MKNQFFNQKMENNQNYQDFQAFKEIISSESEEEK